MDDTQRMIGLLRRLKVEMNGAVVDAMRSRGLDYPLSYGVSGADDREIAKAYAPAHAFALFLFRQQVRELKSRGRLCRRPFGSDCRSDAGVGGRSDQYRVGRTGRQRAVPPCARCSGYGFGMDGLAGADEAVCRLADGRVGYPRGKEPRMGRPFCRTGRPDRPARRFGEFCRPGAGDADALAGDRLALFVRTGEALGAAVCGFGGRNACAKSPESCNGSWSIWRAARTDVGGSEDRLWTGATGSSDPLRFAFGETRGGSATGDRSGRRGPFGLPARRRRALCMTTVRAFGWPLWNGMCIVTARRGRLPGLSWMRSDEPILFRVSGFCPAVFAVRSGRAGFGRTAGRTGPDWQGEPLLGVHSLPVRARDGKALSRGDRGPAVVRTGPLAQVAAENPSVQLAFVSFAAFDGPARDAAGSVDSPSGQNGSGRTRVDAAVAVSAAVGHGRPAGVELGRRDDFAQQHERSRTGMDQERVPSDPAESGLGGPCLLDDRGRIGESAVSSESGYSSRTRTSSSASFSRSVR